MLSQHRRGERAEALAELDLEVDTPLGVGIAWIGEDGAVAERARPELGAALHPPDRLPLGKQRRDLCHQLEVVRAGLHLDALRRQRVGDLVRLELRAEGRTVHGIGRDEPFAPRPPTGGLR